MMAEARLDPDKVPQRHTLFHIYQPFSSSMFNRCEMESQIHNKMKEEIGMMQKTNAPSAIK